MPAYNSLHNRLQGVARGLCRVDGQLQLRARGLSPAGQELGNLGPLVAVLLVRLQRTQHVRTWLATTNRLTLVLDFLNWSEHTVVLQLQTAAVPCACQLHAPRCASMPARTTQHTPHALEPACAATGHHVVQSRSNEWAHLQQDLIFLWCEGICAYAILQLVDPPAADTAPTHSQLVPKVRRPQVQMPVAARECWTCLRESVTGTPSPLTAACSSCRCGRAGAWQSLTSSEHHTGPPSP